MSVERIDHAAFGGGGLLLAALEAEVSAIELCSWFVHGSFMYVVHSSAAARPLLFCGCCIGLAGLAQKIM